MKASLIVFGVIFLLIGGSLYFVPRQVFKVDTTTSGDGSTDTRTSSARVTVPVEWAFAAAIIGFISLVLGLAIPDPSIRDDSRRSNSRSGTYEKTVESKEDVDVGDGNKHRVFREHSVKHRTVKDAD